jgi:drug/metabolite transporter (DMT)-like permease
MSAEKRPFDLERSSVSTSSRNSTTGPLFVSNVLSQQQQPQQDSSSLSTSESSIEETVMTLSESSLPSSDEPKKNLLDKILSGYLGPRLLLGFIACFYATNFPLGAIMADALPASAVTSARMVIAGLAMSPFVFKLTPEYRIPAISIGCFTAMGYIAQSMALVDTSPATVSFLGTATVLVCPFLEWAIDKKPMSLREAPQTWLAAILCMAGVGVLELLDPAGGGLSPSFGTGDLLALVQAVGFGTQVYLCEGLIRKQPDQALPVTATLVCTTAFLAAVWSLADGWLTQPGGQAFALPQLLFQPELHLVAAAILWTGLVSTALNFFVEMTALGRVPPAEASVILATEPMWAALFAAGLLGESFGMNDYVGGALIVMACLANTLKPADFHKVFGTTPPSTTLPE